MASVLATLAEAVKTALNAGSFSLDFEAERVYIPEFTPATAGTDLSVKAVGRTIEFVAGARAAYQKNHVVDIGIQQRLPQGSEPTDDTGNAELDGLVELAEQVADFFTPGAQYGSGQLLTVAVQDPVFIPAHLREHKVFTSVVSLTFRVF